MSYYPSGFGSNNFQERFDEKESRLASHRIWKRLFVPEHSLQDPNDPYKLIYNHRTPDELVKEQMARRMDRKVIKLEAAFGSDRQSMVVKRNQDLIVQDVMEDIQKTFKIPLDEQVIFHKGTNLCDFPNELLENLGIENNNNIRVTRDPELPKRSPRSKRAYMQMNYSQMITTSNSPPQGGSNMSYGGQRAPYANGGLDPVSYLKEISPQRVPDPTPYQVQVYNQAMNSQDRNRPNDVIKLYVSYGSEKEYILVHGKKPLTIADLKRELSRLFKIAPDQQCVVFKGYNLHEYLDEAPLEAFGLENNSPVSLWPKGSASNQMDVRLPRGATPPPSSNLPDIFSPRIPPPPGNVNSRWNTMMGPGEGPTEVLKIEVQHGSDRHYVMLKGQNKNLTVLDLQNELEKITAVPVREQRLYFRSQELSSSPFKTLKECELENNNLVKLVGEPSKVRYSNYFGRLVPPTLNNNNPNGVNGTQFDLNQKNFPQQPYQPSFQQQQQQPLNYNNQQNFNPQQQQQNNYGASYPPQNYSPNY